MTVEEAIAEAREAWIARTAYWYNAVTAPDDLKDQIEAELGEADTDADAALRRIALAAYESMPCSQVIYIDEDDLGADVTPCYRCQKVQEYSA